jgi:twitching motility protein PilJ
MDAAGSVREPRRGGLKVWHKTALACFLFAVPVGVALTPLLTGWNADAADARRTLGLVVIGVAGGTLLAALAVSLVLRGVNRQVRALAAAFDRLRDGDHEARAVVTSRDDLGAVAESLNATLDETLSLVQSREERDRIQSSIARLLEEVSGVAEGDLTKQAEVTADVTGAIADSFNYMIDQLRKIIGSVQSTTQEVSTSAADIHASAEHLVQGAQTQAEQIAHTSAAIRQMAESIGRVSADAAVSADVARTALDRARNGNAAVQDTVAGMGRIRDQVQETAKRIKRLGESSQEIGQVVQLIDDIADRTSILALNASIQAATAGEAGRGFAVVAEEVERLAVRCTEATKKIDGLVRTIQGETGEAVSAMEKGIQEVVEGSKLANQAGRALGEIEGVSRRLAGLIQSISEASEAQANGSEALTRSMGEIWAITQRTADGTKQAAASVDALAGLADELRESVSAFRLPGREARGVPTNGKGKNGTRSRAPIRVG